MADWTPQSRAEEILFKTINGEPYDGLPQSRIEELLLELKEVIEQGGGGGGGTDNYNSLKNLPQINGTTLKGNKTASDLGLPSVAANPTGEAIGELTSIDINGSKYSIPGGGGAYTTTVLFTNGASGDTTFQLSSAYTNFDAIAIYYSHFDGQDTYEDVRTYPTTFLNSVSSTDEVLGFNNDAWYYYFSVYSTTEFRYVKSNAGFITDIIGIKYGSSSGGGGDDELTTAQMSALIALLD